MHACMHRTRLLPRFRVGTYIYTAVSETAAAYALTATANITAFHLTDCPGIAGNSTPGQG